MALLLAAPLVAMPFATRALADAVGRAAGSRFALFASFASFASSSTPQSATETEQPPPEPTLDEPRLSPLPPEPAPARAARQPIGPRARSPHRGLLIRSDIVARAVRSGVRPSAAPVPATGLRPAGLALHGIGAFGAGLHDGDIVTSVAGVEATSIGAVVGAVAGAVRSEAKAISAVVWRDQERLLITVELPHIPTQTR